MTCLADADALALARGDLTGDALAAALDHLDGCAGCRRALAAAAGAPAATAPTTIGRFVVDGVAGAGAMGIVYRARDPRLDRLVALKVIRPDALTPAMRARFEGEARALARVNHPNVVAIHEVDDADGALHLAMEYLPAGTLAAWMGAAARTPREVVDKLHAAGEGLLAAHQAGLVHRDFKPANVLLDDAGRVRVTDFGLAHDRAEVADDDPLAPTLDGDLLRTRTGLLVGTPAYMAPEQHAGLVADPRADQFAFGVTLFEALAGHRPFAGADHAALAAAVQAGAVRPAARPIDRALVRIIRRALAPRPADRFPSMRELLDELAAWQRPRRTRWLVVAAATVAAVFVVAVVVRRRPTTSLGAIGARAAAAAWLDRAGELGERGHPDDAIAACHKAIALAQAADAPAVARAAAERAAWQAMFGQDDLVAAERWVAMAEELDDTAPADPRAAALRDIVRARLDGARGDVAGGLARLTAVADRAPALGLAPDVGVGALEGGALMLLAAHRQAEAGPWLDRLEQTYAAQPGVAYRVARMRAHVATSQGRLDDSAGWYRQAVATAPNPAGRAAALKGLAEILVLAKRFDGPDGAIAYLEQAAAADPDATPRFRDDLACALGNARYGAGQWDAAMPSLVQCLERREARLPARSPQVISMLAMVGFGYQRLARHDLAADYFDRALTRYEAIGQADDAVTVIRWALARSLVGRDPTRARALATAAGARLRASQPAIAADIDGWLAAHKK